MSATMRLYAPVELGSDGYPAAWHASIKHDVRAAAEHRCRRCLHPYVAGCSPRGEWSPCDERCVHRGPLRCLVDGEVAWADDGAPATKPPSFYGLGEPRTTIEAQWRILTVHHLDGDKANCRWWNLAALCQRCHLEIQGRVQMARVWPWEHSAWFRPYVAGYYAWVYLREDISREQVLARLDELLRLERVVT